MNDKDFIPISSPTLGLEEADAVFQQVKSGWISMGNKVTELEQAICDYTGTRYAVAMSNGTATLHAALLAMGVRPGDHVLVPTMSYISSANAVIYCGAKPVFCEVDPETFNITAETIDASITPETVVIMSVDMKGQPADYDEINKAAEKHGVVVLSDSAESFGAIYKGEVVGGQCAIHSFSFFANKNLTMGEGGAIVTDDKSLRDYCRMVRNQGQSDRYVHEIIGHNYRLTDVSAAIGVQQIKRVETIMQKKSQIAAFYNQSFASHPLISTPHVPGYCDRPSWYMYSLTFHESVDRDLLIAMMKEEGVDHRLSFPPIHLQPIYKKMFGYKDGDYPVSERVFRSFLDIPCFADMTDSQMQRVVDVILNCVEKTI